MSITISSELEERLRHIAETRGVSTERLASELLRQDVEREEARLDRVAKVRETLRRFRDEGDPVEQRETLLALVDAWGPEAFGLSSDEVEAMK